MIKCPNCGKRVLGEDLIAGSCSHCQIRLSASDSGSDSEMGATIATEVGFSKEDPPLDSVSGALSGFGERADRPSAQPDSIEGPQGLGTDQTMQSDVMDSDSGSSAAPQAGAGLSSHMLQKPDTSFDSGYMAANISESAQTFISDEFAAVSPNATADSELLSEENTSDRTYVADDASMAHDPEAAMRTVVGDVEDLPDSNDADKTFVSDEFVGSDDPEAAARTFISDSIDDESDGGADKTFVSEEVPESLLKTIESVWGEPESIDEVRPNTTLKAKEVRHSKGPRQTLVIKTKAFTALDGVNVALDGDEPEYELLKVLGEGGMGIVYDARQTSIDRNVAIKMLKPGTAGNEKQRAKFLAEAVVTGDLDHPNIVPIYDVGSNPQGALFYSMKKVQGTPWLKVIQKKSVSENLDILMRIADAVGFAHARGIVHRDLKPENVMLGEFGEVLVMDWGLAQANRTFRKSRSITETNTMGGTPAYMAPEMATGPIEKITAASDIYLLGAMLYEIVTGSPPHVGKNAMKCLMAAARNEIAPTDKTGELIDIALKAMATDPKNRYPEVRLFQAAIREYQSHSESIVLSTRAEEDLQEAKQTDDYQHYSRALFGFQEAHELWTGNRRAYAGISEAQIAYADSARRKGDYDLGVSLLDEHNPDHLPLRRQLMAAQEDRVARQKRLVVLKRIAGGLVATVFLIVSTAAVLIYNAQLEAVAARDIAVAKEKEATEAKDKEAIARAQADQDRDKAVAAEKVAVDAKEQEATAKAQALVDRDAAVKAKKEEEVAKADAEYEAYISKIGLAASQIDKNAFDAAREVLNSCRPELRNWEWGRLMYLCSQSERSYDGKAPLDALAVSRDAKRFATGGWDAKARLFDRETGAVLQTLQHGGDFVHSVAFSPDGRYLATGSNDPDGYVQLWDCQTGKRIRTFTGHSQAVLSVAFSHDGSKLLTGSYDKTAKLWDVSSGNQLVSLKGHTWWVWSAAFSTDDKRVVTTSQDGTAIVWDASTGKRLHPPFRGHHGPVYSGTFSPDGTNVVTGGYDHRILIWNPADIQPENFKNLSHQAAVIPTPKFQSLEGHTDAVRAVAFAAEGGAPLLVSAGKDNTVRVWDFANRLPIKSFRGHGGAVEAAVLLSDGKAVLSAARDGFVLEWSVDNYAEFRTLQGRVLAGHHDAVLGAAYSSDQQLIVTASRDRTARTWNVETGKPGLTFEEGHAYLASSALFFPDGQRLLTAAVDNTARIWDVATGGEVHRLERTGRSAAIAMSSDAIWIATGSDDKSAKLWDAKSGQLVRKFSGHAVEVTALAFSPDSKWLITGDAKGHVKLWNRETAELVASMDGHTRKITAIVCLPDGSRVLTASLDKTVSQWDLKTGKELPELQLAHPDGIQAMKLVPGRTNRVVTSCSQLKRRAQFDANNNEVPELVDCHLTVWNVENAKPELELEPFAGDVFSVDVSTDGSSLIAANSSDRTVRKWDLSSGREIQAPTRDGKVGPIVDLNRTGGMLWSTAFLPGSDDLLTVGGSDARLWTSRTDPPSERMSFSSHRAVASARFSPDNNLIVTGSWDNSAKIWDAHTGRVFRKLAEGHKNLVNTAVFSPDGKFVLTASDDGTAKLWSVETGEVVHTLKGENEAATHSDRVRSAAFSTDGKLIVTTSSDKTARLWDGATYALIREFKGHTFAVLCAEFSPDAKLLITGSEDRTNQAWIWDVATAEVRHKLNGHTSSVTSVSFSRDGSRVLTGSQDQSAKLWDTEKGKEILTLSRHTEDVTSVAFSPIGDQILTGSRDGTAVIWLSLDWKNPKKDLAQSHVPQQ